MAPLFSLLWEICPNGSLSGKGCRPLRYNKGQNGLHLRGLLKPDTRLSIRFIPGINILATKLDWTFNGGILYFQVMKDKLIHVGQRIGTIHSQPFEQPGKCNLPAILLSFIPHTLVS